MVAGPAVAMAGLLFAVALWGLAGGGDRHRAVPAESVPAPATGERTTPPAGVVQPRPGQCVALGADADAAVAVVACTEPHQLEVAAIIDPGPQFRAAPTDAEWWELLTRRCPAQLRAYLGGQFDPDGVLTLRISAPTPQEWAAGDRWGECLVAVGRSGDGRPAETSVPAVELAQG